MFSFRTTPLHIDFDLERLQGLNGVVVEIQDVGVRYFNYTKDVMRLMEMLQLLGDEAPSWWKSRMWE